MWYKWGTEIRLSRDGRQHVLNTLHGQSSTLIMHHYGPYCWKTAVLSVGCLRILSEQYRNMHVSGHPSNANILIVEATSDIFRVENLFNPLSTLSK